ncbi:MAG: phosphodiester glycosidase family protein [Clostridia bacterium]|nr:phosphodiester glycosidase family protein [Clostridia bacterium]
MTAYEEILQLYPLVSYEENRKTEGDVTLLFEKESFDIIEGLHYCSRRYQVGDGRGVDVHIAFLSPTAKAQLAVSAAPLRSVKMVKKHAEQFPRKAYYATNASFFHYFNGGDLTPYGIQIVNGVVMAEPGKDKPQYATNWIGVLKDGTPVIADADAYYSTYEGKLDYAVGGGLVLIKDGEIRLHDDAGKGPRTVVAIATDGTVILLCADGRREDSCGISYGDTIDIFTHLGYEIRDLLNLDGGGSTTVILREEDGTLVTKNVPSGPPLPVSYRKYGLVKPTPQGDTLSRAVADCLLIVEKE